MVENKQTMLAELSNRMGIPEEKIFESFVQSEYSYGVTAALVSIIIFWIAVWCFRKGVKIGGDAGVILAVISGIVMIISLSVAANAVHHIMSPESYAIEKVYKVAVQGHWDVPQ
jgi:hypothetical protein